MSQRYADQGLVIIGIHTKRGGENMVSVAEKTGIPYALALDHRGSTVRNYGVDRFPGYYLVDRAGNLRVADLGGQDLERAIRALLAENPEELMDPALTAIAAKAVKKNKRVLLMWGATTEVSPIIQLARSTPGLRKLIRNEFEVLHLNRIEQATLAKTLKLPAEGPMLTVLKPDGTLISKLSGKDLSGPVYADWLQAQRIQAQDAEVLWAETLKQAKSQNKRVLVYLTAPWQDKCFELEALLKRPTIANALAKDFLILKIDTERHTSGAQVATRLRGSKGGQLPWISITDSEGRQLTTSDRPTEQGPRNIGCPTSKQDQAWFMSMLKETRQRMSKGQLQSIEMGLAIFARSANK